MNETILDKEPYQTNCWLICWTALRVMKDAIFATKPKPSANGKGGHYYDGSVLDFV